MAVRGIFGRVGRSDWLPGLAAVLLIAWLTVAPPSALVPAIERMSFLFFDQYQKAEPRAFEDAAVKVIDIDEESIRRFGQWPWPRDEIAALNDRLTEAGAAVVAYDIVFSEPDRTSPPRLARRRGLDPAIARMLAELPDTDETLVQSFTKGNVVNGLFLINEESGRDVRSKAGFAVSGSEPNLLPTFAGTVTPLPEFDDASTGGGFLTLTPDSDAIVRKVPLLAKVGDTKLPSLSLEALRAAQGASSIILKTSDGSGEIGGGGAMVSLKVGDFEVPVTSRGDLWIHYTPPTPQRVIPAWKILAGDLSGDSLAAEVEGHIIFVGAGAIGLRDLVSTPLQDRELGVMIHAQAAEQMILGHFLVRPDWAKGLEVLLLVVLGGGLAIILPRIGAVKGALIGGVAIAALGGASWYAFSSHRYLLDPIWPSLGVVGAWLVQTVLTFYREEKRRAYIHHAFDRYLSPELVRRIADDPELLELGGVERDMSVLFCDIRSFSRISERLAPSEVIDFLVRFLTPMSDLLMAHKATIDKYIGDAILAFWNAPLDDPDHHDNAVKAALAMQQRIAELNGEMERKGDGRWPGEVKIGIGLNSGACCVGNIGSEQRLSYSLIGDPVNLASRLEGLTKYYGVGILAGDEIIRNVEGYATLPVDRVRVVGRDRPELVHAILGDAELAEDPEFRAYSERHQQMLDAYLQQRFEEAAGINDSNEAAAAQFGLTGLIMLYRDRLVEFCERPPGENWDGVFQAESK